MTSSLTDFHILEYRLRGQKTKVARSENCRLVRYCWSQGQSSRRE